MKVFIDDLRQPPLGYEEHVLRSYKDAIFFLEKNKNSIDSVTIDYDLGTAETGYDILVFMNENNIKPRHINAHSTHKEGLKKMISYLQDNFEGVSITFNKIG